MSSSLAMIDSTSQPVSWIRALRGSGSLRARAQATCASWARAMRLDQGVIWKLPSGKLFKENPLRAQAGQINPGRIQSSSGGSFSHGQACLGQFQTWRRPLFPSFCLGLTPWGAICISAGGVSKLKGRMLEGLSTPKCVS